MENYDQIYYQKNKEKKRAQSREYYKKHRDYILKYHKENHDYHKKWKAEHPERIKLYRKKRAKKQKEYYAKWYKKNGRNRTNNDYEKVLEWRQEHPRRVIIHARLNYAVKSGKIKRPNICPKCGKISRLHAHHLDYKHFMNFVWLCASCHKKEHNKKKG